MWGFGVNLLLLDRCQTTVFDDMVALIFNRSELATVKCKAFFKKKSYILTFVV